MASILTPGYLRWDGFKYVLDHDIEIVGPTGSAGPAGSVGPQGTPGIGVGASATGDLTGIYPGPISVVGLTGTAGVVSFGSAIGNPTITQAGTPGSAQPLTIKSQAGLATGGDIILQSGTGTSAGLVRFLVGNTAVGQFDVNGTLRIGPNGGSSVALFGSTAPVAGNDALFSYNGGSGQSTWRLVSAATANRAIIEAINSAAGGSLSVALRVMASGTTEATTNFAGNGILEQVGTATSALLFSKALGDLTSRGTTGRIYQSGAWGIGDASTNNTSTLAQAGLTGPLLNIAPTTGGSLTGGTVANTALNFNIAGSHHVQGAADVRFDVGNTLAGFFDSNRIFRTGPDAATTANVYAATAPAANNDTIYSYSASASNPNSLRIISNATTTRAVIEAINSSAGGSSTVALRIQAGGSSDGITQFAGQGVVEQVGGATSALLFSKALGDLSARGTTGRIYQSGAWALGDNATNNTSAAAQAGLTGTVLNIAPTTGGSLTSAANQGTLSNTAGTISLQGNIGVNLISGTTTVASTTTSKFITAVGRRIRVTPTTVSYLVLTTDEVVSVGTISAPVTITLPVGPNTGDTYTVKDANGSATAFNITVSGNGNNIDGAATYVMNANYMSVNFVYNGTKWLAIVGPPGPAGPQGIPGASFNISSTVTTVDATTTTLATLALSDLTFTGIDVIVIGKKSGTADGVKFNLSMAYLRQGGAPVSVGTVTSYDQRSTAGASTWTATITTSGNNAIVTVTGQVATTIDWEAQLQYVVVS